MRCINQKISKYKGMSAGVENLAKKRTKTSVRGDLMAEYDTIHLPEDTGRVFVELGRVQRAGEPTDGGVTDFAKCGDCAHHADAQPTGIVGMCSEGSLT